MPINAPITLLSAILNPWLGRLLKVVAVRRCLTIEPIPAFKAFTLIWRRSVAVLIEDYHVTVNKKPFRDGHGQPPFTLVVMGLNGGDSA